MIAYREIILINVFNWNCHHVTSIWPAWNHAFEILSNWHDLPIL